MLSLDPRSTGERLAAAKDENTLCCDIIGALVMSLGGMKINLNLKEWLDAPDCTLIVRNTRYSPLVSIEIKPREAPDSQPQPPGWVDEMRLNFDGLGR